MVHDRLAGRDLPAGTEVIDGGLAGIGLLGLVEDADRVIFVDQVIGFAEPQGVVVLDPGAISESGTTKYGHSGGLAYLLSVLPLVCTTSLPQIAVVGIEGPLDAGALDRAADLALELAAGRLECPAQDRALTESVPCANNRVS
ncbi:unnamed protein product [marine sediment metagenome]|uniref:Hydrogenase maturation protease n=1 Tax=marine sediment metagenome TaxID=412755 RepID=X1IU63_9ZZZZ